MAYKTKISMAVEESRNGQKQKASLSVGAAHFGVEEFLKMDIRDLSALIDKTVDEIEELDDPEQNKSFHVVPRFEFNKSTGDWEVEFFTARQEGY